MKLKLTALVLSIMSVLSIFKTANATERNKDLAAQWLANNHVEQTGDLDFVVCEVGK